MEYSVIIPVYNSSETLRELYQRTCETLDSTGKDYEIIFIDDASKDNSWEILRELKKENESRVTAIKLTKNFGQHNATFCGFSFAQGNFIVTLDDDLQIPPEEIEKLIHNQQERDLDLVYGIYTKKQHTSVRNMGSRLLKKSSSWIGRPGEGSSFRLISRDIIEKVMIHHQNFVFVDELLNWYTDSVDYVLVKHDRRASGKSGYNVRKLWGILTNLMIYYTTIPLKLMIYGGFIFSIIFLVMSLIFAVNKVIFDVPLGYTSVIVAILFSTSLILLSIGVIGEYLSRIYMVQNKKPPYSISKVL
jgi:undecaprenyl-phosphate 4-deoxy-4-formamido-L-arabinose transferase